MLSWAELQACFTCESELSWVLNTVWPCLGQRHIACAPSACNYSENISSVVAVTEACSWLFVQHLRDVTDPEHPYTLEQLNVVSEEHIDVSDADSYVRCGTASCPAHVVRSQTCLRAPGCIKTPSWQHTEVWLALTCAWLRHETEYAS